MSFADSLNKKMASRVATLSPEDTIAITSEPAIMTLAAEDELMPAYDPMVVADENWMKPTNAHLYDYYNGEYSDEKFSEVDENKNIIFANGQINLTQEKNSQYIPFRIPRRYDGFDLTTTELSVYWVNKLGAGSSAIPVDVYYNSDQIKFAWLVDDDVTMVAGDIEFEIHAEGKNSKGRGYTWKTRSNKLNVIQALQIKAFIEPDETWQESFIEKLSDQADRAEAAALSAESSARATQSLVAELQNGLADEVNAVIGEKYYTKDETHTYVEQEIEKVDVSDQLVDYAKTEDVNALIGDLGDKEDVVSYVDDAIESVDVSEQLKNYALKNDIPTNISAFTNDVGYLTEHQSLDGYATETFVTDKIGDLGTDAETGEEIETVIEYVTKAVDAVDVTEQLADYTKSADVYTKEETYNKTEIDDAVKNVKVDLSGYATEEFVNGKISPINSAITTINETLEDIDKSPKTTYRATYGDVELEDGSTAEYMYTLWKTENGVEEVQDRFQILGGGGGAGSSVTMKIAYVEGYPQSIVHTVNDSVFIKYMYEGLDSAGDYVGGTASWKVGSKVVLTEEVSSGENQVDLTEYVGVGDNKVLLTITHTTGAIATKSWTIKVVDVRIESDFNCGRSYTANSTVEFTFTPYGSVDKIVHFVLDGTEIGTKVSKSSAAGLSDSYILPSQEHGSHLLEVYMTSDIAESNHLFMDIVWYDAESDIPVIGCSTPELTIMQHDMVNIEFTVFDPSTETPTVLIEDNGEVIATLNDLKNGTNLYTYAATSVGTHELVFICGETRKSISITVEVLDINITPVTASLAFDFYPKEYLGNSNSSEDRLWSYASEVEGDTIAMTVSDNFDWINGGYQSDEDGMYFCIKAGTTATINYKMFCASKNIKEQGGHYKLMFKTMNVQDASQPFFQCYKNDVGVIMQPHETNFYAGSGNHLYLAYSENDTIEFELNMGEAITNSSDKMVMGYEDGVATMPLVYTSGATFIQGIQDADAEYITLGSPSCDLYIYRFKAFRKSLTSKEILNNFITDARSASEMLKRYNRNQIYNEAVNDLNVSTGYSESFIEHFAKQCPDLRVILLSCPHFTKSKSDKVENSTVRQIYANGREVEDNWTVYNMMHSGQGTSSNLYGASGRNLDLIMNKKNEAGEYPWIEFSDGTILEGKNLKLNLTEKSVPINYLNIKLNIASSENANNAELVRRYNRFNPYKRPLVREEGYPYEVKDTMEFYNCVVFVQETDTTQDTNGNYISHVEFNDCNWHYYGLGNIGDSKKTDDTRMNDPDDTNEFVIEIMDNNLPNSKFQSGVYDEKGYSITGATVKAEWQTYKDDTYEMDGKYTVVTDTEKFKYLIDENLPILFELIDGEYVSTSDETIDPSKTYYEKNFPNAAYEGLYKGDKYVHDIEKNETSLESGWGISFECRYEHDDSDHEEHIRLWNEFYEFIIFSSDAEFYAKLKDYCVLNSVMFYYLFTLRYTMIDNRAKNSFFHYGKCEDGIYRWDLTMGYDMDTALGIDNFGKQVFRYGYEDFDYVDDSNQAWVFNAATSTFYNRLRLLFATEMRNLYNELDGDGAWNAEDLIAQFDKSQSQFPEEVWRQDIIRKYIRPYTTSYINGAPDDTFLTQKMNGRKKYHRREFDRNQAIYMASKHRTEDVKKDIIRLRANMPTGNLAVPVDLSLTITPYMHMYISVDYANGVITRQYRGKPGIPVTIDYPLDSGDIVAIENASYIQSIGDISPLYTGEATLTTATRLKEVLLGNSIEGYSNTYLPKITMVKDGLIETINIENIPSLSDELDVSTLRKLKTVLAKGSNIQGLVLAKSCAAETLSLPDISILSMKNLSYLKDIDFDSLENLDRLIIEDCDFSTIENFVIENQTYESPNELTFLDHAPNLQRVRLTNVDWNLPDTSVLERLYSESIGGYNANGGETTRAYVSGYVYVPSITEYDKKKYRELWSDLTIDANVIPQFPVTFVNYNGEILDIQYVIKGQYPVEPISAGRIVTPTREPDIDKVYTFADWDYGDGNTGFISVHEPLTYMATYDDDTRCYTVRFVQPDEFRLENPLIKEFPNVPYGSYVSYDEVPVYEGLEQEFFTYYWFTGWNKSGLVNGDKTITAVYDCCEYIPGCFKNLNIKDMRPVQIYALTKLVRQGQLSLIQNGDGSDYLGINDTTINQEDEFNFSMGYDIDYGDIESKVIVGKGADQSHESPQTFSGTTGSYYDTGISIFDIDRSFVLAVDYEFASGNSNGATLMQCYDIDTDGFKLSYNSSPTVTWFNNSNACATSTNREMLVIRHEAGQSGADIYTSNLTSSSIGHIDFTNVGSRIPTTDSTLVFGCNKEVSEDGTTYKNYAKGTIHWAKIWFGDLGADTCRKLASYIHEDVYTQVSGFRRHYISGTKSTPVLSFLGSRALYTERAMNLSSGNHGGWASSELKSWLNNRFYNGIPSDIKRLIKSVTISSTAGTGSTELVESNCYVYIPAYADLSVTSNDTRGNALKSEISPPGSLISYMVSDDDRIRYKYDGSEAIKYYTRSPGLQFTSYFYRVDESGKLQETGFNTTAPMGVVIGFSI